MSVFIQTSSRVGSRVLMSSSPSSLHRHVAAGGETRLGGGVSLVNKNRSRMGRAMRERQVLKMSSQYTSFVWRLWEFVVKGALIIGVPSLLIGFYWLLPEALLVPVSTFFAGIFAAMRPWGWAE